MPLNEIQSFTFLLRLNTLIFLLILLYFDLSLNDEEDGYGSKSNMHQIDRKDSVDVMTEGYLSQHRRENLSKVGQKLDVADHCSLIFFGEKIDFKPYEVVAYPA